MDVRDRLAGFEPVVDDAIASVQPPMPGELWARGHAWSTRRRRGSLAIGVVAAVLFLAVISMGWVRAAPVLPAASPDTEVTLPDRVFEVPRWLPAGIAGESVVAVTETERAGWTGESQQLAALTASGRYLFLHLPGYADEGFALSPDGRHVGYWTTGPPSGDPHTSDGQGLPVTGVAVYDVVAGTTVRHEFETRHGLSPHGLIWSDTQTVLGTHLQWMGGDHATNAIAAGGATNPRSWSWLIGEEGASTLELPRNQWITWSAEAQDGVLLLLEDDRSWRIEVGTGRTTRFTLRSQTGSIGTSGSNSDLAADGTLVTVGDPDLPGRMPNRVRVTSIDRTGLTSRPRVVPGSDRTYQVLGWRTPGTLLLVRAHGDRSRRYSIDAVDVETGESEKVVALGSTAGLGWSWAEDLLTAEVVPGVAPPSPMDPRVLVGRLIAIVLAAGLSLVWWRRRGQP